MASKRLGPRHLFRSALQRTREARNGARSAGAGRRARTVDLGFLEPLEPRVLLAITVALSGNAVSFTGDEAANNLILAVQNGDLAYSVDGGVTYSQNLNPAQSGSNARTIGSLSSITVNLGTGADTLSIGPALSSALATFGVPLTYTASTSGELASLAGPTNLSNNWVITGPNSGTLDGEISFSGIGQIERWDRHEQPDRPGGQYHLGHHRARVGRHRTAPAPCSSPASRTCTAGPPAATASTWSPRAASPA